MDASTRTGMPDKAAVRVFAAGDGVFGSTFFVGPNERFLGDNFFAGPISLLGVGFEQ